MKQKQYIFTEWRLLIFIFPNNRPHWSQTTEQSFEKTSTVCDIIHRFCCCHGSRFGRHFDGGKRHCGICIRACCCWHCTIVHRREIGLGWQWEVRDWFHFKTQLAVSLNFTQIWQFCSLWSNRIRFSENWRYYCTTLYVRPPHIHTDNSAYTAIHTAKSLHTCSWIHHQSRCFLS